MKYKILLIYVSAGSGHRSAAIALERTFALDGDSTEIKVIDALDYTNPAYKKVYVSTYLNLVKNIPELWGYIYKNYDSRKVSSEVEKLRKTFDKFNTQKLFKFVYEYEPDAVIGTHFLPLQIVSHLKSQGKIKTISMGIVTDYGAHSLWMQDKVDLYFVPTEEVKRELNRFGQSIEKIKVTGIPVDPVFNEKPDKGFIREKIGITNGRTTLLLLSGGYGIGPIKDFILSFKNTNLPIQLLVVAGKNTKLIKEIVNLSINIPLKVFGFVDNINELMEISDIIVTKPGGLTSSEILVKGKPMIVLDPIPGQEQRNCEYLLEQGVATRLYDPLDAPYKIAELLSNKEKLKNMKENAEKIAQPNAAIDIVKQVEHYLGHIHL